MSISMTSVAANTDDNNNNTRKRCFALTLVRIPSAATAVQPHARHIHPQKQLMLAKATLEGRHRH